MLGRIIRTHGFHTAGAVIHEIIILFEIKMVIVTVNIFTGVYRYIGNRCIPNEDILMLSLILDCSLDTILHQCIGGEKPHYTNI